MDKLITGLLILAACFSNAQILDNTEGKTFGDVPFFNEDFIKRNKVKIIEGFYSTKATMDRIRETDDVYYYEFNEAGQLVKDYRTQFGDTLVSIYEYDVKGRLELLRKSDNSGFHSYHFSYDETDRILAEEYRRDINKIGDKANFELDKTFIISVNRYEYEELQNDNYKKIYYNNAGRVYKDEIFYFEENGYLIRQEGRLRMGSGLTNITFKYDEKGRVIEKKIEKRLMGNYTSKWIYEYDEHSNVLAQYHHKGDKYITETQIVYSQETFLLEAIIDRDEETNFVTILKFAEYFYFD